MPRSRKRTPPESENLRVREVGDCTLGGCGYPEEQAHMPQS
jgi:hypothetical protein